MMLEKALWAVDFLSPTSGSYGSGVISFSDGKVFGGDSGFFYQGSYTQDANGNMSATVDVKNYNPGVASIFGGTGPITLQLSGQIQQPSSRITGNIAGQARSTITILMRKLVDL